MKTVGAFEAKTHLSRYLNEVDANGKKIIIQIRGKNIAMLSPYREYQAVQKRNKKASILEGFKEIRSSHKPGTSKSGCTPKDLIKWGRKR